MEFENKQSIYLQIANYISENILTGKWKVNERIPSVRQHAAILEVNLNTIMRSYQHLESLGILENKRGLGFYVSSDAPQKISTQEKETFIKKDLPEFIKKMTLLGFTKEEFLKKYNEYIQDEKV